jgi:hypothetical protein
MWIRTDNDPPVAVNLDDFGLITVEPGNPHDFGLFATSTTGLKVPIAAGSKERVEKIWTEIRRALSRPQHLLDLLDQFGQRPDAGAVRGSGLVVPQGVPPEAMKAAEDAMRRLGNGK